MAVLAEFLEDGVAVNDFTALQLLGADGDFLTQGLEAGLLELVPLFEQAQGVADDFAGGEVAPAFDFGADELFELGGEGDVHDGEMRG